MNKVGEFLSNRLLSTRTGALALWVIVMYATAGLWAIMDDDAWYSFPSYVISVLAWLGSFLYMLASLLDWHEGKLRLRPFTSPRPRVDPTPDAPVDTTNPSE